MQRFWEEEDDINSFYCKFQLYYAVFIGSVNETVLNVVCDRCYRHTVAAALTQADGRVTAQLL